MVKESCTLFKYFSYIQFQGSLIAFAQNQLEECSSNAVSSNDPICQLTYEIRAQTHKNGDYILRLLVDF